MIKYNPKIWFKHIISLNHSDTIIKLWKELIALGIFTLCIAYLEINYFRNSEKFTQLMQIYSLIGFVLSLLLVFRTNTAYDRWWEGRKKWGELVNNSRNLAIKISALSDDPETRAYFKRMISNYVFAMKEHLREGVKVDELDLTEEEKKEISQFEHKPNYIAEKMYATYPKEKVVFVEPNVESHKNLPISSKEDAIQKADLFFILVAHKEFEGMSAPSIISFVNI